MVRPRITRFLASLALAAATLSLGAQWDDLCQQGQAPQYALLGLSDTRFALVRLKDWAVRFYGKRTDPEYGVFGLVYFCNAKMALAIGGHMYPQYITDIDLAKGAVHRWDVPDIPNSRKNIVDFWINADDPRALFVTFSDKYNYLNVETLSGPDVSHSRYDVVKGAWARTQAVYGQGRTVQIDTGVFAPPSVSQELMSRPQEENLDSVVKRRNFFNAAGLGLRDLAARLQHAGVIKENRSFERLRSQSDAILYCGKTHQLCRAAGRFVLTETNNAEVKIIGMSPVGFGRDEPYLLCPEATALILDDLPCVK